MRAACSHGAGSAGASPSSARRRRSSASASSPQPRVSSNCGRASARPRSCAATSSSTRRVGLAERLRAPGRLGLGALRHPGHAHQPRRLVGFGDPRHGAQQHPARVVGPVLADGQLDLHLRPRLDPLRLDRGLAEPAQLRQLLARRVEVALEQREPRAAVAPEDPGVGDGLARHAPRQQLARLREPAEPHEQVDALHDEERVEARALRPPAGVLDLGEHHVERLLRVAREVERLGEVDGRARAVGRRRRLVGARVRRAHRGDALVDVAEPRARNPCVMSARTSVASAPTARASASAASAVSSALAKSPSSISTRARSSRTCARSALGPGGSRATAASNAAKLSPPLPAWRRKCPSRWCSSAARSGSAAGSSASSALRRSATARDALPRRARRDRGQAEQPRPGPCPRAPRRPARGPTARARARTAAARPRRRRRAWPPCRP